MAFPPAVETLERELRGIFGHRLQSLVMYGQRSHAHREAGGNHGGGHGHRDAPPIQTLAVVETAARDDLRACAARIASWHDAGLATPLLLAAHEFEQSLDVFPLEFAAILADHEVVSGTPLNAAVDPTDLRRACEVQARSHLLHLRQGYLESRGNVDALAVLIVASAAPFAALLTSVARLEGHTSHDAAASARHVERALGLVGDTLAHIAQLAGVGEIASSEAERIFPAYLEAVERLVAYVDGWRAA
jgi:hypothetical protein